MTIGELWAVPTMLRLGLIENLRRLAEQMLAGWGERAKAELWVAPLREAAARASAESGHALPALTPLPRISDALVVRALQVVRDAGPPAAFEFLKADLSGRGINVAEVVRRENQRQAVNQVSVGNCVTSLRLLAALDWATFFERTNLVDPVLRQDPAGAFASQDFATRDRYRQAVEKLGKHGRFTEVEVVRRALELARHATAEPGNHVGYYLIGHGADALKAEVALSPAAGPALPRPVAAPSACRLLRQHDAPDGGHARPAHLARHYRRRSGRHGGRGLGLGVGGAARRWCRSANWRSALSIIS